MDRKFYSQNGEDFILHQLFKDQLHGFFVDVGSLDGKRFSNTFTFEERGWKGLCIEAHKNYIPLLKRNRPNSIICHCAAGECNQDNVEFYTNPRGALSTLDKSMEDVFKKRFGRYFHGFSKQIINKRRLDTLLKQYNIKDIDILSIDVEGYEAQVLSGIDFKIYRPKVLIIEALDKERENNLDDILLKQGYHKSVKIKANILYIIDIVMEQTIKNKTFQVSVIHTQHPLDDNGDSIRKCTINS